MHLTAVPVKKNISVCGMRIVQTSREFMTYDRNMNLVPVANAGYKQTKDVKSSIPGIFDEFIIPDRIKIFAK